jgi:hypothetical protein
MWTARARDLRQTWLGHHVDRLEGREGTAAL